MRSSTAYVTLKGIGPFVVTAEAAAAMRESSSAAVRTLRTLERDGLARNVRHGIWEVAERSPDPRTLAVVLTRPLPAYVSFDSALAEHGVIDEIPRRIAVATLGKARTVPTALGTFEFHHIPPELWTGFVRRSDEFYLASVEKAIFDTVYVECARGRPLPRLPEIEEGTPVDRALLEDWTSRIRSARARTLVREALGHLRIQREEPAQAVGTRAPTVRTRRASARRALPV